MYFRGVIMDSEAIACNTEHSKTTLARLEQFVLDPDVAERTASLFRAFADPTRTRIIALLVRAELCVGDLHKLLGMSQPAVSHQLRILRDLRIVRARKEGRHVYYTLDDAHIRDLFNQGLAHVRHS
jgi:ArsR family transcriptional regulator